MSRKKFRVQKRFELWVGVDIRAESLTDAVTVAAKMDYDEFFDVPEQTEIIDCTTLTGTMVSEDY